MSDAENRALEAHNSSVVGKNFILEIHISYLIFKVQSQIKILR